MNFIKRFTTTVSASMDNAVGKLENHDAIIEATIKQTQQSTAKTKARINTLRQQLHNYQTQLRDSREQEALWEKRALKLANDDAGKALECLSRRNQYKESILRLTTRIEQQNNLIDDVSRKNYRHTNFISFKSNNSHSVYTSLCKEQNIFFDAFLFEEFEIH